MPESPAGLLEWLENEKQALANLDRSTADVDAAISAARDGQPQRGLRLLRLNDPDSPDTVRLELADQQRTAKFNYLVLQLAFGSLTHEQEKRSLRLFASEVMPALTLANSMIQ